MLLARGASSARGRSAHWPVKSVTGRGIARENAASESAAPGRPRRTPSQPSSLGSACAWCAQVPFRDEQLHVQDRRARRVFLTTLANNCCRLWPTVALGWTALWNGVPSMAITARLSHTLHQTLGDEAAEDLVNWMQQVDAQRAELRELNELNFARVDTRFAEAREATRADLAELRQAMQADLSELREEMKAGFAELRLDTQADLAELRQVMQSDHSALREEMKPGFAELRQDSQADLAELRQVMQADRADLRQGRQADRSELREEMKAGFAELRQEMSQLETRLERRIGDLIKWSFVFWVGAVGAIAALAGVLR